MRVAAAHKISSTSVTSTSSTLDTLLGLSDGDFDLNGTTIDVFASDTILNLRDRINAANTGTNATGVTASVVSISATQHVLVLTADDTANEMVINNETGGVLASLGISSDGGTTFTNELLQGLDARVKADGLKDLDRFESDTLISQTATLSNYIDTASASGSFNVTIGATTRTINYNGATDTLQTLRDTINTQFGSAVASIDSDPTVHRLVINGSGSNVTCFRA
jgi:flagellar hook-associated protein 2